MIITFSFKTCLLYILLFINTCFIMSVSSSNNVNFNTSVTVFENSVTKFITSNSLPSVVLGLSVKGSTQYKKAFGYADLENSIPATVKTHYRQASITKTFTSAILAELVEKNRASFDDLLSKHLNLSVFPVKTWKGHPVEITLRQVLSHTAGLYSTIDSEEFATVKEYGNLTEYIAKHKDKPLLFEPGTAYSYSNYGFQVIGAVIEAITGHSFSQIMKDFLKRHNLNETSLETRQSLVYISARYYYFKGGNLHENIPTPLYDDLVIAESSWASGGLLSNVDDLLRWGNLFISSYKGNNNGILRFYYI